jgi:hypothetical protein|eukprot:COSAG06_NODE_4270_length_4414_cov_7.279490_6_plen_93_part_00
MAQKDCETADFPMQRCHSFTEMVGLGRTEEFFLLKKECFFRTGGGDAAVLPPQFFAKLRAKGQSEVLQALPVAEALQKLDQLGDDITRWQYS